MENECFLVEVEFGGQLLLAYMSLPFMQNEPRKQLNARHLYSVVMTDDSASAHSSQSLAGSYRFTFSCFLKSLLRH